ncbi:MULTISPECIES: hypothetical protein [Aminobacter]|uniref:hypothetical protein n=1 Tax=Aminobacter TaxID=31988 RepID=UPI000D39D67F|nr:MULTISPECIES: hypothetical protein [Aminobacter]AWC25615.1 hypothetical protein CO731_05114 [Aminobacter sp. MSH1]CAI2936264.1 conserved protein of unknown function [Aminobacter niigataensis]
MAGGTFAVSRGLFDHPFFADEAFTEREAWVWLLAEAAWKPRRVRGRYGQIELERGQLAHATRFIAVKWKWSEARVRRFLARLKSDAMIDAVADAQTTRITICNYDEYQKMNRVVDADNDARNDAQTTLARRSNDARSTLARRKEEKGENIEGKETPIGVSKNRGLRLPSDWALPKDLADWALAEGLSEFEVRREADKFRDYWHNVPGKGGIKLDWSLTWKNWVRKAVEGRKRTAAPGIRDASGNLTNKFLFARG